MSNMPSPLFYFPNAAALQDFERFAIIQTQQAHEGVSVPMWAVTGYSRASGQNNVLAEFHAKGNADTFREMSEIVSKTTAADSRPTADPAAKTASSLNATPKATQTHSAKCAES